MVDLCIAADNATFGVTEAKVGRGSPWAAPLAWIIGPRLAMEILLTGQPITAQRPYELGFVNKVVPLDDLRTEAETMARGDRRQRAAVGRGGERDDLRLGRARLGGGSRPR